MDIISDVHCGFWINYVQPLQWCLLNSTMFEGLLNPNVLKIRSVSLFLSLVERSFVKADQLPGWLTNTQKKIFKKTSEKSSDPCLAVSATAKAAMVLKSFCHGLCVGAFCVCFLFLVLSLENVVNSPRYLLLVTITLADRYQSTLFKSRCLQLSSVWLFCRL